MRYTLLILLILGLARTCQGQSPPGAVLKEPKGGVDENCVYKNKYTETQRRRFYPFSISDTIKLVSFRYHNHNYPVDEGHITMDSLIEQKVLSKTEVDRLTDILYNNVPKRPGNIGSMTECFEPRNAVLFIDKNGKLREYVLICFHCRRFAPSSWKKIGMWDTCDQKSEMILQFFITCGMKFGTDLTINEYPGEGDLPPETNIPLQR